GTDKDKKEIKKIFEKFLSSIYETPQFNAMVNRWKDYKEDIINTLSKLTPENMRVFIAHKGIKSEQIEPYFKVPYTVDVISDSMIDRLANIEINDYFKLREENQYIAKNISAKFELGEKNSNPKLIIDEPGKKIWCMSDLLFSKPQINLTVLLNTKYFSDNIENNLLSKIYVELLNEHLSSKYASAIDALNIIKVSRNKRGLIVNLRGYSLKMLSRIISDINFEITKFIPSSQRFDEVKNDMVREYNNNKLSSPGIFSYQQSKAILEKNIWTDFEEAKVINAINYTKIIAFIKTAFDKISLDSFLYGGVEYSDVSSGFSSALSKHLKLSEEQEDIKYSEQVINIYPGDYHKGMETNNPNHSVMNVYLTDNRDYTTIAELLLLDGILHSKYYDELRTQKQLGYLVHLSSYSLDSVIIGLWNLLESPGSNEEEVNTAINKFMNTSAVKILQDLSNKDLAVYKDSLRVKLLKKPNNRNEVFKDKLKEIITHRYEFERREAIAKKINNITKDELLKRYNSLVLDSQNRKLLSVHTVKSVGNAFINRADIDDMS
ncbi:MAG: hypothetical protein HRT87_11910, partial [Legionellales bacterium]|nr:hypothetical protein [Legionellales bacterium]